MLILKRKLLFLGFLFPLIWALGNNAPIILNNGGNSTASISLPENNSAVTTIRYSDLDGANIDLLVGTMGTDTIPKLWYKKMGLLNFKSVNSNYDNSDLAKSIIASDLDGDGDFDIVTPLTAVLVGTKTTVQVILEIKLQFQVIWTIRDRFLLLT